MHKNKKKRCWNRISYACIVVVTCLDFMSALHHACACVHAVNPLIPLMHLFPASILARNRFVFLPNHDTTEFPRLLDPHTPKKTICSTHTKVLFPFLVWRRPIKIDLGNLIVRPSLSRCQPPWGDPANITPDESQGMNAKRYLWSTNDGTVASHATEFIDSFFLLSPAQIMGAEKNLAKVNRMGQKVICCHEILYQNSPSVQTLIRCAAKNVCTVSSLCSISENSFLLSEIQLIPGGIFVFFLLSHITSQVRDGPIRYYKGSR